MLALLLDDVCACRRVFVGSVATAQAINCSQAPVRHPWSAKMVRRTETGRVVVAVVVVAVAAAAAAAAAAAVVVLVLVAISADRVEMNGME